MYYFLCVQGVLPQYLWQTVIRQFWKASEFHYLRVPKISECRKTFLLYGTRSVKPNVAKELRNGAGLWLLGSPRAFKEPARIGPFDVRTISI